MTRDRFYTARWNNILSLALGMPILVFVIIVLTASVMSDFTAFVWLVGIGVVY